MPNIMLFGSVVGNRPVFISCLFYAYSGLISDIVPSIYSDLFQKEYSEYRQKGILGLPYA